LAASISVEAVTPPLVGLADSKNKGPKKAISRHIQD
jgi:hypothetical protein